MLLDSVKKAGRRGGEKPAETKSLPWRFRPQYPADGPRSAEERPVTDGGPATGGRGAPRTTVQEGISLKRIMASTEDLTTNPKLPSTLDRLFWQTCQILVSTVLSYLGYPTCPRHPTFTDGSSNG
ncbi:uncharacterized protein LOC127395181 isoform X4 [Apus apus]|uniref:uncharacterized protein LOC127395181 isoform X4 n=1 Tax=Apus apus TaxID=8895 RepID=UPI0021F833F6|nr:uncharacterized protein LOC127395181 isoform X4 [Apus apus]